MTIKKGMVEDISGSTKLNHSAIPSGVPNFLIAKRNLPKQLLFLEQNVEYILAAADATL